MADLNPNRRLELDSLLKCTRCAKTPYKLFRRQNEMPDGTLLPSYETEIWPAHRDIDPPKHTKDIRCPWCETPLARVAP